MFTHYSQTILLIAHSLFRRLARRGREPRVPSPQEWVGEGWGGENGGGGGGWGEERGGGGGGGGGGVGGGEGGAPRGPCMPAPGNLAWTTK